MHQSGEAAGGGVSSLKDHRQGRSPMPKWLARKLSRWHRKRAKRLAVAAEQQRKALIELVERAEYHKHRAEHWDLVGNRRRV